jgi:hypothetical protein
LWKAGHAPAFLLERGIPGIRDRSAFGRVNLSRGFKSHSLRHRYSPFLRDRRKAHHGGESGVLERQGRGDGHQRGLLGLADRSWREPLVALKWSGKTESYKLHTSLIANNHVLSGVIGRPFPVLAGYEVEREVERACSLTVLVCSVLSTSCFTLLRGLSRHRPS